MPSMKSSSCKSAIVGFHDIKGNTLWLCNFKEAEKLETRKTCLKKLTNISDHVGPIAKLDKIQFVSVLPKHVLVKLCVEYLENRD
jgi:acetyl-CoA synthetase